MAAGVAAFFSFLECLYAFFNPVEAPIKWHRLEQLCLASLFGMLFMVWAYRQIAQPRRSAPAKAGAAITPRALLLREAACWAAAALLLALLWRVWSRSAPREWPSATGAVLLLVLPVLSGVAIWYAFKLQEWTGFGKNSQTRG